MKYDSNTIFGSSLSYKYNLAVFYKLMGVSILFRICISSFELFIVVIYSLSHLNILANFIIVYAKLNAVT